MSPPWVYSQRPGTGETCSWSALAPGMWRAISSRGSGLAAGLATGLATGAAAAGGSATTGLPGASAARGSNRNGLVEGIGIFTLAGCSTVEIWTVAGADRSATLKKGGRSLTVARRSLGEVGRHGRDTLARC